MVCDKSNSYISNKEELKLKKLKLENQELTEKVGKYHTVQKIYFSIKDFFNKCDQICSLLRIWLHLLKKSLMENFIFCVVPVVLWAAKLAFIEIKLTHFKIENKIKLVLFDELSGSFGCHHITCSLASFFYLLMSILKETSMMLKLYDMDYNHIIISVLIEWCFANPIHYWFFCPNLDRFHHSLPLSHVSTAAQH